MKKNSTILALLLMVALACSEQEIALHEDELTFLGSWKFVSHVLSDCTVATNNREDQCSGSAGECGILTFSEEGWSWTQTLPDGLTLKESGTYYLSTNAIFLTGTETPGINNYSFSGSEMKYTKTTLTFTNYGISDGCFYTDSYVRYSKNGAPAS